MPIPTDLRSQLRVSESERIRLKTESEGVLSEAQGKDRRIRDLEQQLAALIKEYQILVTNDMNLARIMGTLQVRYIQRSPVSNVSWGIIDTFMKVKIKHIHTYDELNVWHYH